MQTYSTLTDGLYAVKLHSLAPFLIKNQNRKGNDYMEWKTIDWKRIDKEVSSLQRRIYRASQRE